MTFTVEEFNQKIDHLIAGTTLPAQYWSADLSNVLDTPITEFVSPELFLPSMDDNSDWYTSTHQLLLVERKSSTGELVHYVESGFLAKWKDENYVFWYDTDAIEKVIGWMPMPALNFSKRSLNKTGSWF